MAFLGNARNLKRLNGERSIRKENAFIILLSVPLT